MKEGESQEGAITDELSTHIAIVVPGGRGDPPGPNICHPGNIDSNRGLLHDVLNNDIQYGRSFLSRTEGCRSNFPSMVVVPLLTVPCVLH